MGQLLGQKNNNLNNNIPFLLLGLGVDDAFVLRIPAISRIRI